MVMMTAMGISRIMVILIAAAAATFDWRIPVHYDGPDLYRVMALSTLLATSGFAILLWRPITVG